MTTIPFKSARDPGHDIIAECAKALWRHREQRFPRFVRREHPDRQDVITGAYGLVEAEAVVVMTELRSYGYINELGLDAIKKAEEKRG